MCTLVLCAAKLHEVSLLYIDDKTKQLFTTSNCKTYHFEGAMGHIFTKVILQSVKQMKTASVCLFCSVLKILQQKLVEIYVQK